MSEPRRQSETYNGEISDIAAQPDARIDVSAQLISLESGLFSVNVVAPQVVRTEGGMVLPCVRLDPLPCIGDERAFVSSLTETSLLVPSAPPTYVRITGGRTSILLTTYKASGPMPAPEIHITLVESAIRSQTAPIATPHDTLPSATLTLLVHIQNHGDLQFIGGAWAASSDGEGAIEGFAVTPGPGIPPKSIEYQAVLGRDWLSPWMEEGEFCGTRQMALSLLGVRIRLRNKAAEDFICRVWGRFDGFEQGPFDDGAVCEAGGAALTGLRVAVVPRRVVADKGSEAIPPHTRNGRIRRGRT